VEGRNGGSIGVTEVWTRTEYETGVEDGRNGLRTVHVSRQRDLAERRFCNPAAKLAAGRLDRLKLAFVQ
jgi:hypothetical protein